MEVKNAVIESVTLEKDDRGFLQCWLRLNYGGSGQGFGGYVLYLPKSYSHHELKSIAGHFIFRCMEIAGVERWEHVPGRTIRVRSDLGKVYSIGHIVKEDWFDPSEDFSAEAVAGDKSEALRDMLDSARSDLDLIREALGVPAEPHQSLLERMVEAAQAKRGAVLDWWKPMPVSGSHELARAFREAETAALLSGHDHIDAFHCGYRALISAAPAPDQFRDAAKMMAAPAEVPMPEPVVQNYPSGKWSYTADQMRNYGDAREAAGYARGLAEAGDRIRRGREILDAALRGEVKP